MESGNAIWPKGNWRFSFLLPSRGGLYTHKDIIPLAYYSEAEKMVVLISFRAVNK
jgi:hypothetical protein